MTAGSGGRADVVRSPDEGRCDRPTSPPSPARCSYTRSPPLRGFHQKQAGMAADGLPACPTVLSADGWPCLTMPGSGTTKSVDPDPFRHGDRHRDRRSPLALRVASFFCVSPWCGSLGSPSLGPKYPSNGFGMAARASPPVGRGVPANRDEGVTQSGIAHRHLNIHGCPLTEGNWDRRSPSDYPACPWPRSRICASNSGLLGSTTRRLSRLPALPCSTCRLG